MKARTLTYLLRLALILVVAPSAAVATKPGLWWEVRLTEDGSQVEITVSTAELAENRSLTKATCQVVFLGRKGLLGTQLYAFPVPLDPGVDKTETFSHVYGDQVKSVNGSEMQYTLTRPGPDGEDDIEESGSIPARRKP